jgi:DNA-binding CsgD family transcriptional regulator
MDNQLTHETPLPTDDILSPAETRVAAGYTAGLIGKEIADRVGISYNTVVKHTQNIYDKAHCKRSTNALVAWFISRNAGIDLREFERRIGALLLLALLALQMAADPSSNQFVRRSGRTRSEARARRGRRRDDESTLDLLTI